MQEERGPRNSKKSSKEKVDSSTNISNSNSTSSKNSQINTFKFVNMSVGNNAPVSAFRPVFPGPRYSSTSQLPLQNQYMIGKFIFTVRLLKYV